MYNFVEYDIIYIMKKLEKSSELLWLLGVIFVALGVAICSKADLGVSMVAAPAFVISEALILYVWSGFSVGVVEYLFQGLLLIILFISIKKFSLKFLLAFLVAVIYGYTLNFFIWALSYVQISIVILRWVALIIGDIITAFGVACFFRTTYPLQVYELFVAKIASTYKLSIGNVKTVFDYSLLVLSIILALTLFGDVNSFDFTTIYYQSFHSIGLGTLVTTFINSPLISLLIKLVDKLFGVEPKFKKLDGLLSIN